MFEVIKKKACLENISTFVLTSLHIYIQGNLREMEVHRIENI